MNKRVKISSHLLFFLLFFAFFVFVLPIFAPQNFGGFTLPNFVLQNLGGFAQDLEVQYPTFPGAALPDEPTLPEYIKYLYNFSIIIAGLVAFLSLIYGGFRYLTSVGQPAAMADARAQITAGILGLIILLGSYLFLVAVNPQLAILYFRPQPPPQLVRPPVPPIQFATPTSDFYEIPIGQLIERALERNRLNRIVSIANEINRISGEIREKSQDFINALNQCRCSNASPSPSSCAAGGFCPAGLHCAGEVCPNRQQIEDLKNEMKRLADEELAPAMESMLPYISSLRKDYQRLKIGADILKETIMPINYDSFLEIRGVQEEAGIEVRVIPFIVLGQRIPGRGDPATFYTDEERVRELIASGQFPTFPRFDTLTTCDQCEIEMRYIDIDIPETIKNEMATQWPNGKIRAPCPNGMDCWDYVINWAEQNNWNPFILLALWGEESGFSTYSIALGCDPRGSLGYGGDIVGQLQCFADTTAPGTGNCQAGGTCEQGNTEFCGFMRCWGGFHIGCGLSDNPNFWPVFFDMYNQLLPTGEQENPATPGGNCTTAPQPLPPGEAGCPLEPGGFSINSCWNDNRGHLGMDLSGSRGTPVYAIADGVAFGLGNDEHVLGFYVRLQTEFGDFLYAHLTTTSHTDVEPDIPPGGRQIAKGNNIGFIDNTGYSFGDHLHLGWVTTLPDGTTGFKPIECSGIQCINDTGQVQQCIDQFSIGC